MNFSRRSDDRLIEISGPIGFRPNNRGGGQEIYDMRVRTSDGWGQVPVTLEDLQWLARELAQGFLGGGGSQEVVVRIVQEPAAQTPAAAARDPEREEVEAIKRDWNRG